MIGIMTGTEAIADAETTMIGHRVAREIEIYSRIGLGEIAATGSVEETGEIERGAPLLHAKGSRRLI